MRDIKWGVVNSCAVLVLGGTVMVCWCVGVTLSLSLSLSLCVPSPLSPLTTFSPPLHRYDYSFSVSMKQSSKKSATGADAKKQAAADAKAHSTAVTSDSMEQDSEIKLTGNLRLTVVGARNKMFYLRMQVLYPKIANLDVLPEAGHGLVFDAQSAAVQVPLSVIQTLQVRKRRHTC